MRLKGKVKWFDARKGFGFIVGPEEQDVFVHFTHIVSDGFRLLKDNETVEYELIDGDKGLSAQNVERLESAVEEADSKVVSSGGYQRKG